MHGAYMLGYMHAMHAVVLYTNQSFDDEICLFFLQDHGNCSSLIVVFFE